MGSIEIIEIRLSRKQNRLLENEIGKIIKEVDEKEASYTMKLYNRLRLKSDYIIIIFHANTLTNNKESSLGQRLKDSLKDFGIINHSVWSEL
jgi:hypothetical protein